MIGFATAIRPVHIRNFWRAGGVAADGAWLLADDGQYYQLGFGLDDSSFPGYRVTGGPQATGTAYIVVENEDTGTRMRTRWATEGDQLVLLPYAVTTEAETNNAFTLDSQDFELKLEGSDAFPTIRYSPV